MIAQVNRHWRLAALALGLAGLSGAALGNEVKISETLTHVDVKHDGKTVRVERIQDQENSLTGGFAKTSRKCPPFCIHPIQAAPGVTTVGELELLDFIKQHVERGTGLLIDARTEEWHTKGTIPGSINIPFTQLSRDSSHPEFIATVQKLGVKQRTPGGLDKAMFSLKKLFGSKALESSLNWDFTQAKELLLWCNGPWCDQSPRAMRGLLKIGYPVEKLRYYRGGMQLWLIHGLTVVVPGAEVAPETK